MKLRHFLFSRNYWNTLIWYDMNNCTAPLRRMFERRINTCFNSIRFGSVRFGSIQFSSVQFSSVRFGSVRFGSVRFGSVQFSTWPTPFYALYNSSRLGDLNKFPQIPFVRWRHPAVHLFHSYKFCSMSWNNYHHFHWHSFLDELEQIAPQSI